MCRGSNLGTCCAQGCDERIACQDTGGYCNEHDPFVWIEPDDDDDLAAPPPVVVDDPEKRRTYDLARVTAAIPMLEASIRTAERRLADARDHERELTAGA